jgi:hypothetical protein
MARINYISLNAPMGDAEKVFGDWNGVIEDEVRLFDAANETMAHLMVGAGAFSSLTQARKNGWDRPIPHGYSEHKVGKHTRIWVWNPVKGKGL